MQTRSSKQAITHYVSNGYDLGTNTPRGDNMAKEKKIRETEAEAVAFVVCSGIGLDTNSASSDYIQLYTTAPLWA